MQFVINSPLSRDECVARVRQSVEGPVGSMKSTSQGWHVLGQVTAGFLEATVVGLDVGPAGRRMLASRPTLSAQLQPGDNRTVIAGEIRPRFGMRYQAFVMHYLLAPMLVLLAVFAALLPETRALMIGVIVLCLVMFFAARWASGGAFGLSEEASERHLLGWLAHAVEGTPGTAEMPS